MALSFGLSGLNTATAAETKLTAENRSSLGLTVYNQNLALVSEERRVTLPAGEALLAIEDVSDQLRAETVLLSGAGVRLLEQSFVTDLLTPQRLLEASLGKTVKVIRTHPQTGEDQLVDAEVLALGGGLVLRIDGRIETDGPGRIAYTEIPPGLRSEPALLARLAIDEAGEQRLRLNYLTSGLSWRADYVARLNESEDSLDLSALVTLSNHTRSDFTDAALRLVAGDVNQAAPPPMARAELQMMSQAPMDEGFAGPPVSVSDRYVYSLARPVTLARGETKQIPLMGAEGVAVLREYRFDGLVSANSGVEESGPMSAAIVLELTNTKDLGLGAPLPAGVVRVYGPGSTEGGQGDGPQGAGDQPLFLGEGRIAHTPEGETARLQLGRAFDVTARAKRTAFERLSNRSYETAQSVTVNNAKTEAVEVLLVGTLPRGWSMLEESEPHELETANRLAWRLRVPAGGQAELKYRIRVSN